MQVNPGYRGKKRWNTMQVNPESCVQGREVMSMQVNPGYRDKK